MFRYLGRKIMHRVTRLIKTKWPNEKWKSSGVVTTHFLLTSKIRCRIWFKWKKFDLMCIFNKSNPWILDKDGVRLEKLFHLVCLSNLWALSKVLIIILLHSIQFRSSYSWLMMHLNTWTKHESLDHWSDLWATQTCEFNFERKIIQFGIWNTFVLF